MLYFDYNKNYDNFGFRGTKLLKSDIYEVENGYVIDIEMAGYKKEDIKLDFDKGYLTVTGKREKENKEYVHEEIYTGELSRTYYLGDKIDPEKISAKYENGILSISLVNKEVVDNKKKIVIE